MCSNMVEMAQATMHMMMRPAGMNMDVMSAMMTACMTMDKACDDMVMKREAIMASMSAGVLLARG